jgi:hypothetical protein
LGPSRVQWGGNDDGFSIKSTYSFLSGDEGDKCKWRRRIWSKDNSHKDNLFLWKVRNRALNTKLKLFTRGVHVAVDCVFCSQCPEMVEHLFFECSMLNALWQKWIRRMGRRWKGSNNVVQWNYIFDNTGGKSSANRLFLFITKRFLALVWNERNRRIFQPDKRMSDEQFEKNMTLEIKRDLCLVSFAFDPGIIG